MFGYETHEVERKLKWKLQENGLPSENVYDVTDDRLPYAAPTGMKQIIAESKMGKPVIAIIGDEDRWTLVCTDFIISQHSFGRTTLLIDDIEDFAPLDEDGGKETYQTLAITTKDKQNVCLWATPGIAFGFLGGLVLMLKRMQKERTFAATAPGGN